MDRFLANTKRRALRKAAEAVSTVRMPIDGQESGFIGSCKRLDSGFQLVILDPAFALLQTFPEDLEFAEHRRIVQDRLFSRRFIQQ